MQHYICTDEVLAVGAFLRYLHQVPNFKALLVEARELAYYTCHFLLFLCSRRGIHSFLAIKRPISSSCSTWV